MNPALVECCSCEELSRTDLGVVDNDERLARLLSPLHFDKKGKLKPSAFAISHLKETGLSLVRVDRIDKEQLEAVVENVRHLSKQPVMKGALIGKTRLLREVLLEDGSRALCVADDPVRDDKHGAIDNEAHAITIVTRKLTDTDVMEVRGKVWGKFQPIDNLSNLFSDTALTDAE